MYRYIVCALIPLCTLLYHMRTAFGRSHSSAVLFILKAEIIVVVVAAAFRVIIRLYYYSTAQQ